jgi:NAD+ kinase
VQLCLPAHPTDRALLLEKAVRAVVPEQDFPDIHVVLGGDGTLLATIHRNRGQGRYLGINCGTLGFLMNDWPGEPEAVALELKNLLEQGRLNSYAFPCLEVEAEEFAESPFLAINDCYVARDSGQTCHLRVKVGGVEIVSKMVCDGIIASTPLGSTAYSFSAGGPISHPLLSAIHLTAICPHSPRLVPMVLPPMTMIEVEVLNADRRPARLSVDGLERGLATRLNVRQSQTCVSLTFRPEHDFTATLVQKILKVQG